MVIKEDLVVDWEVEERENLEIIGVAGDEELKGIDDAGSYIFALRAVFSLFFILFSILTAGIVRNFVFFVSALFFVIF